LGSFLKGLGVDSSQTGWWEASTGRTCSSSGEKNGTRSSRILVNWASKSESVGGVEVMVGGEITKRVTVEELGCRFAG
jgi:hypothetical protein